MPDPDIMTALRMLEYCRFAYKAYAQTCVTPMDPFFEAHGEGVWQGARDRVMEHIHKALNTDVDIRKFDPILYNLKETPHPRRGAVYRGGVGGDPYILFQPRPLDVAIAVAMGVDLEGEELPSVVLDNPDGNKRCCHFQGKTGMTQSHPRAGWPSWLGAVIYDPDDQSITVVFRGSRSGSGGRALAQALTKSQGSPDWVTDMNHLKGVEVPRFDGASLSAGFWYAYESCKKSLEAAFFDALGHKPLKAIYFTGHSLGGALAQCAYIDMVGGNLLSRSAAFNKIKASVPIRCYAISAPPIVLGSKSLEKVAACVGKVNVFHYFAAKDAVHDSSQVSWSGATVMNSMVATVTHPLTSPCHLGTEFVLASKAAFPDAHEPEEVRKGMFAEIAKSRHMGLGADHGFWPTFTLDVARAKAPAVEGLFDGGAEALRTAFLHSTSFTGAQERAELWAAVRKGAQQSGYQDLGVAEGEAFDVFEQIGACLKTLGNPFITPQERAKATEEALVLRAGLLKMYAGASDHKATSACVWMMLQHLAAMLYYSEGLK
ncbi:MAG: hypothetical protein QM820_09070 [Minicystis sp.]